MAEIIYSHAFTTLARVKERLSIDKTGFDALLTRLINVATDLIESGCNRKFKTQTYTNELYSVYHDNEEFLLLKQMPVTALTKLEYRLGLPNNPTWQVFPPESFELSEDGASGLVRLYFSPIKGTNAIRATYTAGYKISFADFGDLTKHNLPADISDLCERLVSRIFKRREAEGKTQETFDGGTVNWQTDLSAEDKDILNGYKKLPVFI